jgi:hypothetical protein
MGMIIEPHEIYFCTFFCRFNMRFGPPMPERGSPWQAGGIVEVAALQQEFEIFRAGRRFLESAALLGIGGLESSPAKDRWLEYLTRLPEMRSDQTDVPGDQRIVGAIVENLQRPSPLPCFMRAYDGRTREPGLVVVSEEQPVFYLESVTFLTISLPMRPTPTQPARTRTRQPRPRTGSRTRRGRGQ